MDIVSIEVIIDFEKAKFHRNSAYGRDDNNRIQSHEIPKRIEDGFQMLQIAVAVKTALAFNGNCL